MVQPYSCAWGGEFSLWISGRLAGAGQVSGVSLRGVTCCEMQPVWSPLPPCPEMKNLGLALLPAGATWLALPPPGSLKKVSGVDGVEVNGSAAFLVKQSLLFLYSCGLRFSVRDSPASSGRRAGAVPVPGQHQRVWPLPEQEPSPGGWLEEAQAVPWSGLTHGGGAVPFTP